jgi:hypothetical protein
MALSGVGDQSIFLSALKQANTSIRISDEGKETFTLPTR